MLHRKSAFFSFLFFFLKKWLTQLWSLGESKIWWRPAGWRLRKRAVVGIQRQAVTEPGRTNLQIKLEGSVPENSLLFGRGQPFVLFWPSAEWMRQSHIREGNIIYSNSTNLNVDIIQMLTLQKHPEKCLNIWTPWPRQIDTQNEPSQLIYFVPYFPYLLILR